MVTSTTEQHQQPLEVADLKRLQDKYPELAKQQDDDDVT